MAPPRYVVVLAQLPVRITLVVASSLGTFWAWKCGGNLKQRQNKCRTSHTPPAQNLLHALPPHCLNSRFVVPGAFMWS